MERWMSIDSPGELNSAIGTLEGQVQTWAQARKLMEEREVFYKTILDILEGVSASNSYYRDWDSPLHRAPYFWIGQNGGRAVVREFIPGHVGICETQEEWDQYHASRRRDYGSLANYWKLPPNWGPLISAEERLKVSCPHCKRERPVIGHWPKFRIAEEQRMILCCRGVQMLTPADFQVLSVEMQEGSL